MRASRFLFVIVLVFIIFESVRLWTLSPATMAAHFNIQGAPNRFVSKGEFFFYEAQTVLVVIGSAVIAQILLAFTPIELLNVPNREVWRSTEYSKVAINRIGTFLDAIFGSILIVIHVGFELAVSANLHKPIQFSATIMIPFIAGFMIFSFGMLFWLISFFRNPPASG